MSLADGDPGSLSASGSVLSRLASGLRHDAVRITAAYAALDGQWSGPASVAARRRGEQLVAATRRVADALDTSGRALQHHSSDLAALLDRHHDLAARAQIAGLQVTEEGVLPAPGIRGTADPVVAAGSGRERQVLHEQWRVLVIDTERARHALVGELARATAALAATATGLRRL